MTLSIDEVERLTWPAIQTSGLLAEPGWNEVQIDARTSHRTRLVWALNGGDPIFFVDLTVEGRGILAVIDGVTGELLWARLNPPVPACDSIFRDIYQLETAIPPSPFDGTVEVVWKICRETFFSPWYPLARVKPTGGTEFYVRLLDGSRFTRLSEY